MKKFSYLVVGSGSIARRHIQNIKTLFVSAKVGCVSSSGRALSADEFIPGIERYLNIHQAIEDQHVFAIVASPAPFHVEHATILLESGTPVLIEKPLSDSLASLKNFSSLLDVNKEKIDVAYNIRFMPSAIYLRALLKKHYLGKIYNVKINVGQYLPDWRPGTDYSKSVSARRELGGGVLLELSHELDYLTWLFGRFDTAYCIASNTGSLKIDVEDNVDAILYNKNGLVANLHMDFLQRSPVRTCTIIGENGTLVWNILHNTICFRNIDHEDFLFSSPAYDKNNMYLDEVAHFAKVVSGECNPAVGIDHALNVLYMIDALKNSSRLRKEVNIGDFSL